MAGIRALHAQFPNEYNTETLAEKFAVSPEAIRRILKSKWTPSPEEEIERQERWFRRGKSVWGRYAEMGMKPPLKWRREGVARDPSYHENRRRALERRMAAEIKDKSDGVRTSVLQSLGKTGNTSEGPRIAAEISGRR
jgi:hypothetical protein